MTVKEPELPAENRFTLDEFSRLVGLVYRSPFESPPWKSFLDHLRELLNASFVAMVMRPATLDRPSIMVVSGPTSVVSIDQFNVRFSQLDPFVNLPKNQVFSVMEVIREEQWLESTIYREYLKNLDVLHVLGADLSSTEDDPSCRFRITGSHMRPLFSEHDKEIFRLLLPHIQQSMTLWSRMDHIDIERHLFAGTVERMQVGTVTLDENGEIMMINAEAQAILDQKDGIRRVGNVLKAEYPGEDALLQQLTSSALAGCTPRTQAFIESFSITRPSGRNKFGMLIRSIEAGEWSDAWKRPKAVVFFRDPEHQDTMSAGVVRRLFGLTQAETALTMHLVNGLTLDEAAERLNISRNTARSHLKLIFSKMGVARQAELVRIVLNVVIY